MNVHAALAAVNEGDNDLGDSPVNNNKNEK